MFSFEPVLFFSFGGCSFVFLRSDMSCLPVIYTVAHVSHGRNNSTLLKTAGSYRRCVGILVNERPGSRKD